MHQRPATARRLDLTQRGPLQVDSTSSEEWAGSGGTPPERGRPSATSTLVLKLEPPGGEVAPSLPLARGLGRFKPPVDRLCPAA